MKSPVKKSRILFRSQVLCEGGKSSVNGSSQGVKSSVGIQAFCEGVKSVVKRSSTRKSSLM